MVIAETDLAYAAALLDGEGCIAILRMHSRRVSGTYRQYALQIRIANTDAEIFPWFRSLFGGTIYTQVREHARDGYVRRVCFIWHIGGRKARAFLEVVRPYVRIKNKQLALALQFLDLGRQTLPEVRAELYEQMGVLNFRKSGNKTPAGAGSVTNTPLQ